MGKWDEEWQRLPMGRGFISAFVLALGGTVVFGAHNLTRWQVYVVIISALLMSTNLATGHLWWLWRAGLLMAGFGLALELLAFAF